MKKIARVFPRRTKFSPIDEHVYFDTPGLFTPKDYDEVHVSVVFTEDLAKAEILADRWRSICRNVKIGGPARSDPGGEFTPGMYVKKGVTITSRGCPFSCWFCYVPKREGNIRELTIRAGNIVQDNNLLACSKKHLNNVFSMLKTQKKIEFAGGLDSRLLKNWMVEEIRGLSIRHIFIAYDDISREKDTYKAVRKLRMHFDRRSIRCYVLIGYHGDTIEAARSRLLWTWEIGCMPFAMRFKDDNGYVQKEREWNLLAREFSRPAAMCVQCPKETGIKV